MHDLPSRQGCAADSGDSCRRGRQALRPTRRWDEAQDFAVRTQPGQGRRPHPGVRGPAMRRDQAALRARAPPGPRAQAFAGMPGDGLRAGRRLPGAQSLPVGDSCCASGVAGFSGFAVWLAVGDASGLMANDFATSAATCGCMARIGEGAVIGISVRPAARVGTENRSCTGSFRPGVVAT